ncbi:hypothetical protein PR048_003218 [Dryococelus australis]|uniref:MADF domain-containing protein n=1 Tax=Dryococelus australis TaxID=614101 RepID=A0ABQ9INX8_9NEOP|nr:hypothetical protein PR048_003218 [Dryococelus australis]
MGLLYDFSKFNSKDEQDICVYTCEPNRFCNRSRAGWDGVNCAPNEPLENRWFGSAWSRAFSTNTERSSVQLGTNCWQNPKDENHYKINLKEDPWRDIGRAMAGLAEECRNKIVCVLSSYRREKSKESKSKGTGKGASGVYKSKWVDFEALQFLEEGTRRGTD